VKAFFPEREQRAAPMISAVKAVSEQTGRSMAQVALAWLRHQTAPIIPIIGARKVSQLQDNLASLDLELSAEQLKSLDEASRIDLDSLRVFTTEKWFVKLGMAARGIACCCRAEFQIGH
jgi:aryl-alcohol dehydrogenase-like predicted oxidoreductase